MDNDQHDTPPSDLSPEASPSGNEDALATILLKEPLNDWGNARVFDALNRNRLASTLDWGWTFYNGKHWECEGGEDKALMLAGETVERRLAAWKNLKNEGARGAIDYLESCFKKRRLTSILDMATGRMRVTPSRFDAEPYLLNVGNGVVDLRTGGLLPHAAERFITMWSPVHFDVDASSRLWDDTVTGIATGDAKMADFLQCLAGYAATGGVSAQKFHYFLGEGANGKSLLTDLWAEVIGGFSGTGYAVKISNETIAGGDRAPGAPSPDLMALRGKRLALVSEQSDNKPLNTKMIKDLTGGDSITARAPHGRRQITFTPTHTLICCGNHIPCVNTSDYGFWRRMQMVPFNAKFKPSRLGEELRDPQHLSAILAWVVRGAMRFYRNGWDIPGTITEATAACSRESDPLAQWFDECCEPCGGEISTTDLFDNFDAWRTRRREVEMSHSLFTRRLQHMGYKKRKSNGKPLLGGLRLRPGADQA